MQDGPDVQDSTPLSAASWQGHKGVVQLLIDSGAGVDKVTKVSPCAPLLLYSMRAVEQDSGGDDVNDSSL